MQRAKRVSHFPEKSELFPGEWELFLDMYEREFQKHMDRNLFDRYLDAQFDNEFDAALEASASTKMQLPEGPAADAILAIAEGFRKRREARDKRARRTVVK